MQPPLDHIPDVQGYHYRLQLSAYKYILEKYYDMRIAGMFVVCTHPDNGGKPFVDRVPPMPVEIEAIMEAQRRRVLEVTHMQQNDVRGRDPLGSTQTVSQYRTATQLWQSRPC